MLFQGSSKLELLFAKRKDELARQRDPLKVAKHVLHTSKLNTNSDHVHTTLSSSQLERETPYYGVILYMRSVLELVLKVG